MNTSMNGVFHSPTLHPSIQTTHQIPTTALYLPHPTQSPKYAQPTRKYSQVIRKKHVTNPYRARNYTVPHSAHSVYNLPIKAPTAGVQTGVV